MEELHRETVKRLCGTSKTCLLLDRHGRVKDTVGVDLVELLGETFDFTEKTSKEVITSIANQRDPFGPDHLKPIAQGGDITLIPLVTPRQVIWVSIRVGEGFVEIEARPRPEYSDPLTGLFNRRGFEKLILTRSVKAAQEAEEGRGVLVCMIDVDEFKLVNTMYGHLTGDVLLAQIGQRLYEACPSTGYVARWAGDEFALVLPAVTFAECQSFTEKLQQYMNAQPYDLGEGKKVSTTVSTGVGWSPCNRQSDTDTTELVTLADRSLLKAKHGHHDGRAVISDITDADGLPPA